MSKSLTIQASPMLNAGNQLSSISSENPGYRMNAVLYIPQSLSPEQQAQARANIGAAEGDEVPTRVSQLDNDMNYTTQSTVNTLLLPKADLSYVQTIGNDVDTLNSYSTSLGNQIDTTNLNVNDLTTYANSLGNDLDGKVDSDDVYTKTQSDNRFEPLYVPEYITDTNIL